jgi:hypothetical protein
MTAQRFPRDFDGIVAGAPGYAWTDLMSFAGRTSQSLNAQRELSPQRSYRCFSARRLQPVPTEEATL